MAEDITTQEVEQVDNTQQQLPEQPPKKLSVKDFATKIKEKYPEYNSVADDVLVNKMIEKYPVYKDQIDISEKKNIGQTSEIGGQEKPSGISPTPSPSPSQLPKVKWEENPLNPLAAANKAQTKKEEAQKIMPQPTPTIGKKAAPTKTASQRKSIAEAPKEGEGFLSTISQMAFAPLSKDYVKYFYNQILSGIGEISSSASDLVMQGLVNVLPEEALGATKNEVLSKWRNEAEPIVREGIKQQIGTKLPKEKESQFDNNLVTSAVGGIGRMIPALASPYKAGIFLQAYDNGIKSVNESEVGKDLPESVKTIWGTANGVIMKALMDFQLDKIFGKQAPQVASKITANIFSDLLKNTEGAITKEAFESAANNAVKGLKNKIVSTGGNLAKTGLESTLLGAGFGAIDIASKEILNKSTGKKVFEEKSFEVPKDLGKVFDANSWGDGWGEILHSGASMGIQGLTMRGAFIPFANTDNYIKSEVAKARTPEDINSLKTEIISQVNEGAISPEDAQRVSDTIDKYVNINSKIPADVQDREKAIDLVEQKEDLKQAATDKLNEMKLVDDAYHPEMQQEHIALLNRANELNQEITGQPSEPAKHSMYADPLELPELKEQITDIQRRIDLGGADGEKAKQELAEIKTDPIKFYEDRKQNARENLTEETDLNKTLETYDGIINKIKQYDKKNEAGLSGGVGVGEEPIEAKPIEGRSTQEVSSSGVLQAQGAEGKGEGVEGVGEKVSSEESDIEKRRQEEYKKNQLDENGEPYIKEVIKDSEEYLTKLKSTPEKAERNKDRIKALEQFIEHLKNSKTFDEAHDALKEYTEKNRPKVENEDYTESDAFNKQQNRVNDLFNAYYGARNAIKERYDAELKALKEKQQAELPKQEEGVEGVGEKVTIPNVKDFTKQIEPTSSTIKTVSGDKAYNYINKDGVEVTLKEDEDGGYVNGNQVQADVHLDFIGNDTKRGEGLASKELDRIIAQADKNDMSISLVVDSDQAIRGTTSKKGLSNKELKKWYESKGFIFDRDSRFGYRPKATEDASIYKKAEYIAKKGEVKIDDIQNHSSPEDLQEAFDQDRLKEGTFHEDGDNYIYKVENGKLKEVKNVKYISEYEKGVYKPRLEYIELPKQKEIIKVAEPIEALKEVDRLNNLKGDEYFENSDKLKEQKRYLTKINIEKHLSEGWDNEQFVKSEIDKFNFKFSSQAKKQNPKSKIPKIISVEVNSPKNYKTDSEYAREYHKDKNLEWLVKFNDGSSYSMDADVAMGNPYSAMMQAYLNNYHSINKSAKLAESIFGRIESFLPSDLYNYNPLKSEKIKGTEFKAELPEQKEKPIGKPKRKASDMAVINRVDAKKVYQEVYATDEPVDAIGAAQRWLSTGNKINEESFAKEVSGYIRSKGQAKTYMPKDVKISEFTSTDKKLPSVDGAAHIIWESLPEHIQDNITDQDIKNALIDQLQQYNKRIDIAKDYVKNYSAENALEKHYKDIEEREKVAFEKEMKDLNEWMQQTGEEEGQLRLDEDYVTNLIKQYEEESRNEPRPIEGEDKGIAEGKATGVAEEVSSVESDGQKKPTEVEPPIPPTISKQGTLEGGEDALKGITMADNAMRRQEIGMPERMPNPETVEGWRAEAEKKIADGYNINDLIDKMERGEQTDKVENEISRIFAATLDAEVKRNPSNENIDAYQRLIKAREKSSSEIGRALRSLQGMSNPFENISDFYVAKKEANKVDNLTDAQKAEVQKDFENIQKAKDEYEKKWKEAEAKFAEMQAQNELLRQQKEKDGKRYTKEGKRDFTSERKDLKEQLKNEIQKYKNNTQKLGISSNGGASDFAITVEMAKIIGKIAKSHVEEVGAKLSEVTQKTFDDVKDLFDGITTKDIHDVIAGKYSERKETKSELLSNLRQIQSEAKLLNELDRVLAREPKDEKQKIEKNQKLADLRRQINDVKKSGGLEEYSEEARAKKAIEANKKKEEKIKERLANNDFDPETKRESIYDSKEFKSKNPKLYKELLDSQVKKQETELEFHKKLVENEMANMGNVDKFKQVLRKSRGTIKSSFAGIDFSAIGVQNIEMIVLNPVIGAKAIKNSMIDFWSQNRFDRYLQELHNSSDWNMMKESGLQVSEPKSLLESGKEEMFLDRFKVIIKIKGKEYGWINIGGKKYELFDVLKPFERAFTSLGNNLRVIKFRTDAEQLYKDGITFENKPSEFKALATRINNNSSAPKIPQAFQSDLVGMAIWSPRLMASKLNILGISDLLSFTPLVKQGYYRSLGEKGKILSRQQLYAVADLAKFATSMVTVSYLLAYSKGGQLNTNPFDNNFMDVELPNGKSYNFTGGFSKYMSTLFQLARGGKLNKITGEFEKYKGFKDRGSEVMHFLRGKMPPISGSVVNLAVGKDYTGKETSLSAETERYKMPMAVGQIYDQIQKDGYGSLFGEGIPTFLGINVKDKRDYMETGLFTKEDIDRPELKVLTDKGLSIPKLSVKETYKVKRDEAHPEGIMTDDEYKELSTKVHDYMINGWEDEDGNMVNGIKDVLNTNYNIQTYTEKDEEEPSKEEIVLGKDLPADQLKNKLSSLKDKAVKKAIEDMGLTKKSKIVVKEEE